MKVYVHPNTVAEVSPKDFKAVNKYKWYLSRKGYARRNKKNGDDNPHQYMHRMIISAEQGQITDHINRQRLDNRRTNLRIVTPSQNRLNSSQEFSNLTGHKNISWVKHKKLWRLRVIRNGEKVVEKNSKSLNNLLILRDSLEGN